MKAIDLLNSGDLQAALAEAKQVVRSSPGVAEARSLLCQLFCFDNDWERADKQLEILGQQHTDLMVGISLLRQLVRGEIARKRFYSEGGLPEVLEKPDETMNLHLRALLENREGNRDQAVALLNAGSNFNQALAARQKVRLSL